MTSRTRVQIAIPPFPANCPISIVERPLDTSHACAIALLPVPKTSMSFYDFDKYERLVSTASALDGAIRLLNQPGPLEKRGRQV